MTAQTERERADIIATCDRIAQRMGGRFVEDNPMTDTPEPVAWLYTADHAPEHREVTTQRYNAAYIARLRLTETPLYTRPADDLVRQLVGAIELAVSYGWQHQSATDALAAYRDQQ